MSLTQFFEEFQALPEEAQQEVADFAAFLKSRHSSKQPAKESGPRYKPGLAKGMAAILPGFDDPIPGFEAYM